MPTSRPAAQLLIVDDERDTLESMQAHLERSMPGVRITTASSGHEGIPMLRDADLIFSDYRMPGMDGLHFLKEARLRVPQTPRVLMTAYPELDVAINSLNEAKVARFLAKPLDPDHVLEVVVDLLSQRRKHGPTLGQGAPRGLPAEPDSIS